MNLNKYTLSVFSFLFQLLHIFSLEPFTILGISAVFGGAVYKNFQQIKDITYCKFNECCNEDYIKHDISKLHSLLKINIFGQPVVVENVVPALLAHLKQQPRKPLVMSFHGWPGTGKNYVVEFIIESLFEKGTNSKYVHKFNGGHHFPVAAMIDKYKVDLITKIKEAVSDCKSSVFIFDEVDKMPEGLLDAIKPMFDFNSNIDGVDYRNTIFIFLSNKGGTEISTHLLQIWNDGLQREDTKLSDFERLILRGVFNAEEETSILGRAVKWLGLANSATVKNSLIDLYIPFFPLEQRHVELCARHEFKKLGIYHPTNDQINEVLSYMTYGPEPQKLFSNSGCKRVTQKVATIVTKEKMDFT